MASSFLGPCSPLVSSLFQRFSIVLFFERKRLPEATILLSGRSFEPDELFCSYDGFEFEGKDKQPLAGSLP